MSASRWTVTMALAWTLGGCGETTYDLYEQLEPGVEATGGRPPATGSGGNSNPGGGTGGINGTGGGTPVECQASRDPSFVLVRLLSMADGQCVSQGSETVFIDSPGYETMVSDCAEDSAQYWTVRGLSDGSWELRNEAAAMNLDINYAYTADGTPVVLFTPHRLDNQRFFIVPGSSDSFLLAPYNAPSKCVEVRDGSIGIWPCDAENPAQNFQQIGCLDEE